RDYKPNNNHYHHHNDNDYDYDPNHNNYHDDDDDNNHNNVLYSDTNRTRPNMCLHSRRLLRQPGWNG
ncbi:hypothetical protein H2200_008685, partial [Cladophialophora chaetospira]